MHLYQDPALCDLICYILPACALEVFYSVYAYVEADVVVVCKNKCLLWYFVLPIATNHPKLSILQYRD
jgi:hypothetical protein